MLNQNMPVVMIGAGGHARVLLSTIQELKLSIIGVCDLKFNNIEEKSWFNVPILKNDTMVQQYDKDKVMLVNGIGKLPNDFRRREIFHHFKNLGYHFATLVHPTAWIDSSVILGEGVQVMAGVVIQAQAYIGDNVIINTRASVDHDCKINHHAFLGPGCVLCGDVKIHDNAFVGAGAVIAPGIQIGESSVIGAGAPIVRDIPAAQKILPTKNRTGQIS